MSKQMLELLRSILDEVEVDTEGKCSWSQVANILPRMRGELRSFAESAVNMEELHAEIRKIAEAWKGANDGIYAINGMALEIAQAFAPRLAAPASNEPQSASDDFAKWLDDKIEEAAAMQKASFDRRSADGDKQGERWNARQRALYETKLKLAERRCQAVCEQASPIDFAAHMARLTYNDSTLDDCTETERGAWLDAAKALMTIFDIRNRPALSRPERS